VSVHDDIFPAKQDVEHVQTEWSTGWGAGFAGFAYAAAHLTKHRAALGATIDQAGLALIFLQRHHVELGLKVLLEAAGAPVSTGHSLEALWRDCEVALSSREPTEWAQFADDHHEFVVALDTVDQGSYTFRYPVDTQGRQVARPDFVNLDALQRYGNDLHRGVTGFIEYLEVLE
jgi:hypothetical protein